MSHEDVDLVASLDLSPLAYNATKRERKQVAALLEADERVVHVLCVTARGFGLLALTTTRALLVTGRRFLGSRLPPRLTVRELPYGDLAGFMVEEGRSHLDLWLVGFGRRSIRALAADAGGPPRRSRTDIVDALAEHAPVATARMERLAPLLPAETLPAERAAVVAGLGPSEQVINALKSRAGLALLTDRRILVVPFWRRHRRMAAIEYRVIRTVEPRSSGTPGMTTLVVASNLDQRPIEVEFSGRGHRERAAAFDAELTRLRRLDHERRQAESQA